MRLPFFVLPLSQSPRLMTINIRYSCRKPSQWFTSLTLPETALIVRHSMCIGTTMLWFDRISMMNGRSWVLLLVRACLTLTTTLTISIGLPLSAVAWLNLMIMSPRMDYCAESIVRFHRYISCGVFYIAIVYSFIDTVLELRTKR